MMTSDDRSGPLIHAARGEGRRTLHVAMAASGYAARSACTTATDELPPAAQ
jgi:hypothetical protein